MIEPSRQWILSAGTLLVMWLAGEKRTSAWVLGLVVQVLWTVWALMIEAYGLLPVTLGLFVVYARNLVISTHTR